MCHAKKLEQPNVVYVNIVQVNLSLAAALAIHSLMHLKFLSINTITSIIVFGQYPHIQG
jgi:hypothetical protein